MIRHDLGFLITLAFLAGCGRGDVIVKHFPAIPDTAIYDDCEFESQDGMRTFKQVVIDTTKATSATQIVFVDDSSCLGSDFSQKVLSDRGIKFEVKDNDGQGNYSIVSREIIAYFEKNRPTRIYISSEPISPGSIRVKVREKTISIPIPCAELEQLLGTPDQMDTVHRPART